MDLDREIDAWLLVWGGPGDWRSSVDRAAKRASAADPDAHLILSREIDGERWSLLLVHYSRSECDALVDHLRRQWTYGFVNAVLDLDEINR